VKKAVEWARQAVALAPQSSVFHDTLGWAERAAGNLPGGIASLRRAIELDPKVAGYHYHLGVLHSDNQQPAEARAALRKALELDPRLPEARQAQQLLKALPPG
jgi:Flp pilus assembly protein TadD